jgi:hypothetical protein
MSVSADAASWRALFSGASRPIAIIIAFGIALHSELTHTARGS